MLAFHRQRDAAPALDDRKGDLAPEGQHLDPSLI
jgi:hypothetical protein